MWGVGGMEGCGDGGRRGGQAGRPADLPGMLFFFKKRGTFEEIAKVLRMSF